MKFEQSITQGKENYTTTVLSQMRQRFAFRRL